MKVDRYKYAVGVYLNKMGDTFEYEDEHVVAEVSWAEDIANFKDDVWESIIQVDKIKSLEDGTYFVFAYGDLVLEFSSDWETGDVDLDAIYMDIDYLATEKLGEFENG